MTISAGQCQANPEDAANYIQSQEAEIARLTEALAKQTEQSAYPCSPHCAGYLREQALRAALTVENLAEVLIYIGIIPKDSRFRATEEAAKILKILVPDADQQSRDSA